MNRRDFIQGATGLAAASAVGPLLAQTPAARPVKTVRTNVLEIAYHETGDASAVPVILLHGFPDDAHAYDGVAPLLAKAGYRALARVSARLRPDAISRSVSAAHGGAGGDRAGRDRFRRRARLPRFAVAGFDWGGRAACVAAALHPDRVRAAVLDRRLHDSEHGRRRRARARRKPRGALWYQWYFNTDAGRAGARAEPPRPLPAAVAGVVADLAVQRRDVRRSRRASFDNPDFVDCVIHSYRHRNFNAPGEPRFAEIEQQLAKRPPIEAPAIALARRRRCVRPSGRGNHRRRTRGASEDPRQAHRRRRRAFRAARKGRRDGVGDRRCARRRQGVSAITRT